MRAFSPTLPLAVCTSVILLTFLPMHPVDLFRRLRNCASVRHMDHYGFVLCCVDAATTSPSPISHLATFMQTFPSSRSTSSIPSVEVKRSQLEGWRPSVSVRWFAPFFSSGGYSSEALSYVAYLTTKVPLAITHHGDSVSETYLRGLPMEVHNMLRDASRRRLAHGSTIDICHSEPGAWSVPTPKYPTSECPTKSAIYSVGRTMFETDRIPQGWAERINALDEVWVPARFHVATFQQGGVSPDKIHVVPEAVDTVLFDPRNVEALPAMAASDHYKFLSIFKWEARKGWDVLLRAYFGEFSRHEKITLFIRTYAYHSKDNFMEQIELFGRAEFGRELDQLPHIALLQDELPLADMPRLYKAADCFVLPSRGEGWGRPHMEAMAMGIPTMATNWSGNTEFMLPDNSFLIPVEGLETVPEGGFSGHLWAKPSVKALRQLMRRVHSNPDEAKEIGEKGRRHINAKYTQQEVGKVVLKNLFRIEEKLYNQGRIQRSAEL